MSNYEFVELTIRLIGGGLAPSSQAVSRVLVESPLAGEASTENDSSNGLKELP